MDNKFNIIDKIKIKNYIKIILVKNNILKKFNISFNQEILNNLLYYYPKLKYNVTKNYISISKNNYKKYNFNFNKCGNNIIDNPCKKGNNNYKIIIGFNTKSKIYLPIDLLKLECDNNSNLLKFTKNIEKILKKDIYLKDTISYVTLIKDNDNKL